MENSAKSSGPTSLLKGHCSYFDFSIELDIRRASRHTRVMQGADANKQENAVSVGLKSNHGKSTKADFDNLIESTFLEASQKFSLFQSIIEELKNNESWQVTIETKPVPRANCRKKHRINGGRRHYCSAIIELSPHHYVGLLEIELAQDEALSTLIYPIHFKMKIRRSESYH
jgi:hypothetical protein